MYKVVIAVFLMLAVVGCSTTPLTDAQYEAMNRPTFEIDCESACSVAYNDPRDRPQLPTNGYDVANNALRSLTTIATTAAPWAAVGIIAYQGIENAGDRSVTTTTTTNDSTHTPTIVEQPAPIITSPVVVNQPDPIIVTQPDPVIVTP